MRIMEPLETDAPNVGDSADLYSDDESKANTIHCARIGISRLGVDVGALGATGSWGYGRCGDWLCVCVCVSGCLRVCVRVVCVRVSECRGARRGCTCMCASSVGADMLSRCALQGSYPIWLHQGVIVGAGSAGGGLAAAGQWVQG